MAEPSPDNFTVVCPRCGTPVRPNTPFCDHCGARVTPPPACTLCGTLLEPNSRFCPSCGTMIGASPDHQKERDRAGEAPPGPTQDPKTAPKPSLGRSWWRRRAGITIPPGIRSLIHPRVIITRYRGAILIGAAIILFLAGIIMLAGSGFFTPAMPPVVITPSATVPATVSATQTIATSGTEAANRTLSLVPGPVDTVPQYLRIYLEVSRDPRSHIVSVAFRGGEGQLGVREIFVRLTRSDGTILTGTFKPVQTGSGIDLQGTENVDRVEVTARYFTGDEYKIADQIFEYKIRN